MSSRSRFITAILSAGVLSVALTAGAAQHKARSIEGDWQVTALGALPVPQGVDVTMRFDANGRVTGTGGCNRYFGGYRQADDALTIGPVGMSSMACPGRKMQTEARFGDALTRVAHGEIIDGDVTTLILRDAQGVAVITARLGD